MISLRPLISLFHGLIRRLLNIWVKTDVVGANEAKESGLDPDQPIFYALPHRSYSASLVLDTETRKHQLPSALAPIEIAGTQFSIPYLHESVPDLVSICQDNPDINIQIVPVNVFWGREPKKEKSFLKLWLGDSWSVSGRFRRFMSILMNGRNTFVHISKAISIKSMLSENPEMESSRYYVCTFVTPVAPWLALI